MSKRKQQAPSAYSVALTVVVIVAFLYWARVVIIPIALAVFITFILSPAVSTLRRWGFGRVPAVALIVTAALVAVGFVGALISWQVANLVRELPNHQDTIRVQLEKVRGWIVSDRLANLVGEVERTLQGETAPADHEPVPVIISSPRAGWMRQLESYLS